MRTWDFLMPFEKKRMSKFLTGHGLRGLETQHIFTAILNGLHQSGDECFPEPLFSEWGQVDSFVEEGIYGCEVWKP